MARDLDLLSGNTDPVVRTIERRASLKGWLGWEPLAVCTVFGLSLLLRMHNFTAAPLLTDNADELDWAWSGLTLLTLHEPYGWSWLPGYHPVMYTLYNNPFAIVHPYLDHPPLFSLLIGAAAWIGGARTMFAVTLAMIRPPVIILSLVALGLTYLLGRRLLGKWPAMIAIVLLATAPGAVLLDRQVESESLLAVLLLGALLCTLHLLEGRGGKLTVVGLAICCGLAPFTKVPGVAVAGIAAVALVSGRRWAEAGLALGAAVLGLGAYVVYGALLDWHLFLEVMTAQSARREGLLGVWYLIASPAGANRDMHDGWWLLGWLGTAGLLCVGTARRAGLLLAWPSAAYALAIMVLAADRDVAQFGWYRVTVYPEIYLAAGWLVWEAVRRPSLGLLALVLGLGGATATEWWLGGAGMLWVPNPFVLSAALLALLGPAALVAWQRRELMVRRWASGLAMTALALLVFGNVVESLRLDQIFAHM